MKKTGYARRDFLKIASALTLGSLLSTSTRSPLSRLSSQPNIIVLLFDTMTARNLSLYGYDRLTSPHLAAFAEHATMYHHHYSAGNFTTPGTASMLTGLYPWKHRAFNQGGLIKENLVSNNPFTLLGSEYERFAFSQNPWPDRLVGQFYDDVETILSPTAYSLRANTLIMDKLGKDRSLASIAIEEFLFSMQADTIGSSLLGYIYKSLTLRDVVSEQKAHARYPHGVPEVEGYVTPYLNEDVYQGVLSEITQLTKQPKPFFAYFHLFSPHSPYKPRKDFLKLFHDTYHPIPKPFHPLGNQIPEEDLLAKRTVYDQQVAQVDHEFGTLMAGLEAAGILENSYVIATSDHGEMFERGFTGHGWLLMYESNIHIPLLIHSPAQKKREDVYEYTSNVDMLPTLLQLAGRPIPDGLDGRILAQSGEAIAHERPIFSMYSVENSAFAPIKKGAIAMRKGPLKLITYLGYGRFDGMSELYNTQEDPEELEDLAKKDLKLLNALKAEFNDHLNGANKPYLH